MYQVNFVPWQTGLLGLPTATSTPLHSFAVFDLRVARIGLHLQCFFSPVMYEYVMCFLMLCMLCGQTNNGSKKSHNNYDNKVAREKYEVSLSKQSDERNTIATGIAKTSKCYGYYGNLHQRTFPRGYL